MRTRRSWRNQEKLWKILGGDPKKIEKTPPRKPEEIDKMFWLSKKDREWLKQEQNRKIREDN